MKQVKKGRTKWIVIGLLAVAAAAAAAVTVNSGITVDTAAVDQGEVRKLLKETGTAESERSVTVAAKNSVDIKGLLVEEGDHIQAGDLLISVKGTSAELDIKSQRAELTGLQAQYNQAKELANKNKNLYEQGALSYEDYNASNTAAKQLASQISALQYSIESYRESSGAEGVTAPVSGYLTGVYVEEGEFAPAGTPLFEISDLDDIYIKTDFIADDADRIKVGDKARIYNEDTGLNDENGTVRKIYLKAEDKMSELGVNQKRVTVEISFGTQETLRLGSDVDVEITVEKKENVLRVPDLAVFEKNQKNCVYVIENGRAVLRQVDTGLEGEDYMEVVSGLSKGDTVILSPSDSLSEGDKVKSQ